MRRISPEEWILDDCGRSIQPLVPSLSPSNSLSSEQLRESIEEHRSEVEDILSDLAYSLEERGSVHDESKLLDPEWSLLLQIPASGNYQDSLSRTLKEHWKHNRHHMEHFQNGIWEMDLLDILEMLADWTAHARDKGPHLTQIIDEKITDPLLNQIIKNTVTYNRLDT